MAARLSEQNAKAFIPRMFFWKFILWMSFKRELRITEISVWWIGYDGRVSDHSWALRLIETKHRHRCRCDADDQLAALDLELGGDGTPYDASVTEQAGRPRN